jgi:hypothetical protein
MTRPHLIAKLILTAIGIHLLMSFLGGTSSFFATLHQNRPPETFVLRMFIITAKLIITLTVSLILLFRSDWLVKLITGRDAEECEKVSSRWIIAGFRIIACLCGLLIIYRRIDLLFYYVPLIINGPNILSYLTLEGHSSLFSTKTSARILVEIVKWIIAIYLTLGASHYAHWQMRKQGVKI